jgi:hypothetical protein
MLFRTLFGYLLLLASKIPVNISQRKPCACKDDFEGLPTEGVRDQVVISRRGGVEAYTCRRGWGFQMMDACWRVPLEN